MAGNGPLPNPNARRRRASKTVHERTLPLPGEITWEIPRVPRGLGETGQALFRRFWSSPVASRWSPVDGVLVERLATLLSAENPSAALFSEARQLEDRLGLSPMARKRLGLEDAVAIPLQPAATVVSLTDRARARDTQARTRVPLTSTHDEQDDHDDD